MSGESPKQLKVSRWAVGAVVVLALGLVLGGCKDEAPLHEQSCTDGRDDDGDGRTDCDDTDCWGTPECPENQCGDNAVGGTEECDGSDLDGYTCEDLGYDGGVLDCAGDCTLVVTGCTGDAVCGNGIIDGSEQCDGAALGDQACEDFGYTGGTVTCDASCLVDVTGCEGKLLGECYDYGDLSGGVDGQLTCASEVGVMQWDWYTLYVQAGDCVDIYVDNGTGAADLVAFARDADGITSYGLDEGHFQLDDEFDCDQAPWSDWGCPAAALEALTTGTFRIHVAQWYEEQGTEPGVDTCVVGQSAYTLFVALNGIAATPVLEMDDQPL
jgi:hypothetical protein